MPVRQTARPSISTTQVNPWSQPKGPPPYIRAMGKLDYPFGLLAYGLLRAESLLKTMCFIDNEYGQAAVSQVHIISTRAVSSINAQLAKWNRPIRIFGVTPFRGRHHHIEVYWCFTDEACRCREDIPFQRLIVNLYPLSKRTPSDDAERSEPMRGSKRSKKVAVADDDLALVD